GLLLLGGPVLPATAAGGGPKAPAGPAAVSASSTDGADRAANLDDGDANSYWQSRSGALPQWAQLDLGRTTRIDQVRLKVPSSWSARSETLALRTSLDGTGFSTVTGAKAYRF